MGVNRNKHTFFPSYRRTYPSIIEQRMSFTEEYKEKFGEIKDIKHFQDFMRKKEKELLEQK